MKHFPHLLLATAVAGLCMQAQAAFIEDGKASLELRNFYFNRDFRQDSATQAKAEEWAQGFLLRYESGFTEGTVGVGVDAIGLLPGVDRTRIGAIGICGLSGMALTAASADSRIKAVATSAMYDMSRSMSRAHQDSYTRAQRQQVIDYLSQQRWADAESGQPALGLHEVPLDEQGRIVKGTRVLPEKLPPEADPVLTAFFNYYRTRRGFHPRSINSTTAWTATTPMAFFGFPLAAHIDMIAPRPILLVTGDKAHSRYYSDDVYQAATGPKELLVVPDADHVDLYDNLARIPFDRLDTFFKQSLA